MMDRVVEECGGERRSGWGGGGDGDLTYQGGNSSL